MFILMKIEPVKFKINYPIEIFNKKKINFKNKKQRKKFNIKMY